MARETLTVSDELARELASRSDELLAALSERLDVRAFLRGDQLILDGEDVPMEQARAVVDELEDLVGQGLEIGAQTVDAVSGVLAENGRAADVLHDIVWRHRGKKIAPKTGEPEALLRRDPAQHDHVRHRARRHRQDVPGDRARRRGAGQTARCRASSSPARRSRPASGSGSCRATSPAKVDPYLRPLFDALMDMLDFDRVQQFIEKGIVEVAPLAFMRGRTLNDSFIILDEAQNTTPEQMQMFLTRLGFGSQVVVTGDVTQIDLPRGQGSGLIEVREILDDVPDIEFVLFDRQDVVRHKLVQRIVDAYRVDAERRGDIR